MCVCREWYPDHRAGTPQPDSSCGQSIATLLHSHLQQWREPALPMVDHGPESVALSISASYTKLLFLDKLVQCVADGPVLSTHVSEKNLRSNRKLRFCCQVSHVSDPNSFERSKVFEIEVQTGKRMC